MIIQIIIAILGAAVGATAGVPLGRWLERRDRLNAHAQGEKVLEAMKGKPKAFVGMTGGGFYFFHPTEISERCGIPVPDVEDLLLRMETLSKVVREGSGFWARIL